VPAEKLEYVLNVLAQYLDNDGDGIPDNGVACWLAKEKAVLYMPNSADDSDKITNDAAYQTKITESGYSLVQDLYGHETHPSFKGQKG